MLVGTDHAQAAWTTDDMRRPCWGSPDPDREQRAWFDSRSIGRDRTRAPLHFGGRDARKHLAAPSHERARGSPPLFSFSTPKKSPVVVGPVGAVDRRAPRSLGRRARGCPRLRKTTAPRRSFSSTRTWLSSAGSVHRPRASTTRAFSILRRALKRACVHAPRRSVAAASRRGPRYAPRPRHRPGHASRPLAGSGLSG
jgi:hypothetical protein